MHLPLTPHHVILVSACYPPSGALLTAGPDFKPNSQELSRLTYYASNHPGKITKLSNELQKRILNDSRKAQARNMKSRASLLVGLAIFQALASECRRDLALLSASLMASLDKTLLLLSTDLEVTARVASVFTAWTTYTDGHIIGGDASVTRDYLSIVRRFASLCMVEARKGDQEERNRTRLIGLGALTGAVTSPALYNSWTEFKNQVSIITPALLLTLQQAGIDVLNEEAEIVKMNPSPFSPYLAEFRARPSAKRRAASIHVHVDGDKGPSMGDVTNATLRALFCLVSQSNDNQVGAILEAVFNSFQERRGWEDIEHCCWIAQIAVQWTQYPYRYTVPTRLVERLMDARDDKMPSPLQRALAAMIKAVFTSPNPLNNLSTSDIISNLITLIFRRVAINPTDSLLPDLVECIASLGEHIFYADQIQDLACELISRLVTVEANGIPGKPLHTPDGELCRREATRCLIAGLVGLMHVADKPNEPERAIGALDIKVDDRKESKYGSVPAVAEPSSIDSKTSTVSPVHPSIPRRSKIPPEAWQDTLTLLCDADYAVREDYSRALLTFLRSETPKEPSVGDSEPNLTVGPVARAQGVSSILNGDDATTRCLNTLHAALYVLATSSSLGSPTSSTPSGSHRSSLRGDTTYGTTNVNVNVNIIPSTPPVEDTSNSAEAPSEGSQQSSASQRRSMTITPQGRKLAVAQRLQDQAHTIGSDAAPAASASDYSHIMHILCTVHEHMPCRGLLTGVPMVIALQRSAKFANDEDKFAPIRKMVITEVILRTWLVIGRSWQCDTIVNLAEQSLLNEAIVPETSIFASPDVVLSLERPACIAFDQLNEAKGFTPLDTDIAIAALAANRNAQVALGLDEQSLLKCLSVQWTPEYGLKNSVPRPHGHDIPRGDGVNPVLKISPALMHIENLSLQSLTRSTRGVGVNDLRDALEGRSGMSSSALVHTAPSVSSYDYAAYSIRSSEVRQNDSGRSSRAARIKQPFNKDSPNEVRDVLNRLGIGPKRANSPLKPSHLNTRHSNARPSTLVPPYKT